MYAPEYATAKAKVQTKKKNAVPTLFAEADSEVTADSVKTVVKESKYIYGVTVCRGAVLMLF
jgi:hypothetical protein